jgi:hypothetical protein
LRRCLDDAIVVVAKEESEDGMITGLRIAMRGDELVRRITERIEMHQTAATSLAERLKAREGDLPFDVRVDDGFKTFAELQAEHQRHVDRVVHLGLLRDGVALAEVYDLTTQDLHVADLIGPPVTLTMDTDGSSGTQQPYRIGTDGLKVTIPGQELRERLEERIAYHRDRAEWWNKERTRTPEEQTEDEPLLPDHLCENEAERHEWRAELLQFVRDHTSSDDLFRMGADDLAFAELLPEKPWAVEQEEHEERIGALVRRG